MPFTRQEYIGIISDKLAVLQKQLENRNTLGMFDSHTAAENFFCGLLNILKDWKLVNANALQKNHPGIDLIDEDNSIVIQVSSRKDPEKIQSSIDKFLEHVKPEKEFQFYMLVITEKQKNYIKEFTTQKTVKLADGTVRDVEVIFDKSSHIWDISDLLIQVKKSERKTAHY